MLSIILVLVFVSNLFTVGILFFKREAVVAAISLSSMCGLVIVGMLVSLFVT